MYNEIKVGLIIPTYKPDKKFINLLHKIDEGSILPNKIIILNTIDDTYKNSVKTIIDAESFKNIRDSIIIKDIHKDEFDHGRTRNLGAAIFKASIKEEKYYYLFMTQDAVPYDKYLIENMVSKFSHNIALSYARQLTDEDASEIEKMTRIFNYGNVDIKKDINSLELLGIKTYFCSNVCAMYEGQIFDMLGGFKEGLILNEDMIYAYKAIQNGYTLLYNSYAKVVHYHNYSSINQLKRNFDIGVSQVENKEIFENISSEKEGKKLVINGINNLIKRGKFFKAIYYTYYNACKYIGFICGKHYKNLPRCVIKKMALNSKYFDKDKK